jgi:predicted ATP-grasp superfamily ATP-dependent carboligase
MGKPLTALVVGDSTRATLATVRSLGRAGVVVDLSVANREAPVTRSHYVRRIFGDLPEERYDLIIPTTEGTAVSLSERRDRLPGPLALPPRELFDRARNKVEMHGLAESLNIPVPKTRIIKNIETNLPVPCVVKPVQSRVRQGSKEIGLSVKVAHTKEEVQMYVRERLEYGPVLVQDFFEGIGVGQEFLCKEGDVVMSFEHHRVREHDGSGGSTYRVSAKINEAMLAHSKKLLKALNWDGVAMVEYRLNKKSGEFVFIEFNGRLWGSLPLAVAAGADFPKALFDQYAGKTVSQPNYKVGMYGRDVVPDTKILLRRGMVSAVFDLLGGLGGVLLGEEEWDAFAFDDMLPGFQELKRGFGKVATKRHQPMPSLKNAHHILVTCYGNVNRSPLAAAALRKKFKDEGKDVEVRSSGTHAVNGRPATIYAREYARAHGLSLDDHVATLRTPELARWADVELDMDSIGVEDPGGKSPEIHTKVFDEILRMIKVIQ